MCRVYSSLMAVETFYNYNHTTATDIPGTDVVITSNRSVGIFNSSINVINSFMTCSFSRLKNISALDRYFFDLSNPYYILLASGGTNSLGNYFK